MRSLSKQAQGLESLAGQHVLIVGIGREALALATRLLASDNAASIVAVDGVDGDLVTAWRERFGDRIPVFVVAPGADPTPAEVSQATIAIVSPGIPKTGELFAWVASLGIELTSGTALFVAGHAATMVGVTGSKGKSTTSALIHHLLEGSGVEATLAGNMGIAVHGIEPGALQVVELSSYQCSYLTVSPRVVVLTALFPEHLDWHGSVDAYYGDKLSIVAGGPESVIANAHDPVLRAELERRYPDLELTWVGDGHAWHTEARDEGGVWLMKGSERLCHSSELSLIGSHNIQNALLALAGADATGLLDLRRVPELVATFSPLPNRLQRLKDPSGILFINDSLATNPQAAVAALQAFPPQATVILVGGRDRGVDYSPLINHIAQHPPKAVIGLPDSGARLVELCEAALSVQSKGRCRLEVAASMAQAVSFARDIASPGDYVVLSPGAPSFGQYRDFQHRADDFIACITQTQENDS